MNKKLSILLSIVGIFIAMSIVAVATGIYPDTSKNIYMNNPYSAVLGSYDSSSHPINNNPEFTEVMNYTWYLPISSNVKVETSGQLTDIVKGFAEVAVIVDSDSNNYVRRLYTCYTESWGVCEIGFQTSRVYYLNKGWHTVKVSANSGFSGSNQNVKEISILIIENQRGNTEVRNGY